MPTLRSHTHLQLAQANSQTNACKRVCLPKRTTDRQAADRKEQRRHNRVDGLTGFFTDEVRLSHHCTYGSRIQRFIKLWSNLFVVVE